MVLAETVNVGCETGTIVMIGKRGRMSETTSSLSRVPVIETKRIRLNSVITKHSLSLCCPMEELGWEWVMGVNGCCPRYWWGGSVQMALTMISGTSRFIVRPRGHTGQPLGNRKFKKELGNGLGMGQPMIQLWDQNGETNRRQNTWGSREVLGLEAILG